jgi:hypothetical protein
MTQRALDIVPTDELPPLPKAYQDAATEIRKRVDDLADIASTQRPDSAFNTLNSVLTSTAEAQATFSYRHVELLLAQSRPLLDRALAGRAEWDNFFEKSLATLLELYEFVQLNAVHESEVKAGLYGLGLLESAADVTVETKTGTRAQESWNHAESAWKAAGNDNFQVSSVKMSQAMNAIPLDAHPDRVKYLNAKNDYEQANVTQRFRFSRTQDWSTTGNVLRRCGWGIQLPRTASPASVPIHC